MSACSRNWRSYAIIGRFVACFLAVLVIGSSAIAPMLHAAPMRPMSPAAMCVAPPCTIYLPVVTVTSNVSAVTGAGADLFVAAGATIIRLDSTDPTALVQYERVTLPDARDVYRLFREASYLYALQYVGVGDTTHLLLTIINWPTGSAPQIVGRYDRSDTLSVTIQDSWAYAVTTTDSLAIVDFRDPGAPQERSVLALGENHGGRVAAWHQTVYVAGSLYLTIVDARSPNSPRVLGSQNLQTLATDAVVDQGALYVPEYQSQGGVWNLDTPQRPGLKHTFSSLPLLAQLAADSTYVYQVGMGAADVTTSAFAVHMRNTSDQELPFHGGLSLPAEPRGVFGQNGIAYIATAGVGLLVVDVRPSTGPVIIGRYML